MTSIILLSFNLFLALFSTEPSTIVADDSKVIIEMINTSDLNFKFSLKHSSERQQILIRSSAPIKTFRLADSHGKKESYNIVGSNLIVLPMADFTKGDLHYLEFKFIDKDAVVLAKVTVPEDYGVDQ